MPAVATDERGIDRLRHHLVAPQLHCMDLLLQNGQGAGVDKHDTLSRSFLLGGASLVVPVDVDAHVVDVGVASGLIDWLVLLA